MIVVTGAAGFIGSALAKALNDNGHSNLILVDKFDRDDKKNNWFGLSYKAIIDRDDFIVWLKNNIDNITFIYHLGARTDTTEFDLEIFQKLNLSYSKSIWNVCLRNNTPLVYASSAATYGEGELGYNDNEEQIVNLRPLNPYGQSKQDFDVWVLKQKTELTRWAGLKFFNVFGPNEGHKSRMASVVFHAYNQIKATSEMKLFRSHRPGYENGEQKRDFVYIKDVVKVLLFFMKKGYFRGIYNLGSGEANTFNALVGTVFESLKMESNIQYIDTPEDIRDKYQYYTKAEMDKLRGLGFNEPFSSFKEAISDYVLNYLEEDKML